MSHNGRYGVVLLAETAVRPGALLDLADQMLDEVARRRARPRHPQEDSPATAPSLGPAGREATRGGPARRLRMPLHRDPKPAEPRPSDVTATEVAPAEAKTEEPASEPVAESPASAELSADAESASADAGPDGWTTPAPAIRAPEGNTAGVDIIALAREFAGLITEPEE